MSARGETARNHFHLRTEERSSKPHPHCYTCANNDSELYMPKLSLPKLGGDRGLVTTKLSETVSAQEGFPVGSWTSV